MEGGRRWLWLSVATASLLPVAFVGGMMSVSGFFRR